MIELGRMYHKNNMVMQLHIGALRNNNSRMFKKLGPDVGFDSIDDGEVAKPLSRFLDLLDTSKIFINPNSFLIEECSASIDFCF